MYIQLFSKTFNSILEKKYILLKALFIPFIILTLIEYFNHPTTEEPISIYDLISFLITIIMSISIHRILLLGNSKVPTWGMYMIGKREINFAFKFIILSFIIGIVTIGLMLILTFLNTLFEVVIDDSTLKSYIDLISLIIIIPLCLMFGRALLVFPAIAVDKPIDMTSAFTISKDYKFLMAIVMIIPLLWGTIYELLITLLSQNFFILFSLLDTFVIVLTVGYLSMAYKYIMSKQPIEDEKEIKDLTIEETENSYKITIDDRHNISFNEIKEKLLTQYSTIGFTNTVIDKPDSWMLKNEDNEKAYVLVSHKNNEYKVETFNVNLKPEL